MHFVVDWQKYRPKKGPYVMHGPGRPSSCRQ